MPLSGEQAYRAPEQRPDSVRPEAFFLALSWEEIGFLDTTIEECLLDAWECQNSVVWTKLRALKFKIEELKNMKLLKGNPK